MKVAALSDILNQPADMVAKDLLGYYLIRRFDKKEVVTKIVETEAYRQSDQASHSFRGPTKRTEIMFGDPGFAYVYFTYGLHYCMNVVCEPSGIGSAVLIRAVEPLKNSSLLYDNRPGIKNQISLTNGPAKLTKALAIDRSFNGHNLSTSPLILKASDHPEEDDIVTTTRIGISKGKELPWRFYLKSSPYVSKL